MGQDDIREDWEPGEHHISIKWSLRPTYKAELESPLTGKKLVAYGETQDEACSAVMLDLWNEYDEREIDIERTK